MDPGQLKELLLEIMAEERVLERKKQLPTEAAPPHMRAADLKQLGTLDADVPEWSIAAILVVQGVGTALAYVPTTVGAMSSVAPEQAAAASAMQNLDRQLMGALGVALLSAVLVSRVGAVTPSDAGPGAAQNAYNLVFLVAAAVAAVGTVVAARLPRSTEP